MSDLTACPYVGLIPFTETDEKYFFGREDEGMNILANLLGRRLVLLYGPSGAGKSSVLRALVVNRARRMNHDADESQSVPVVHSSWSQGPARELAGSVAKALGIPADDKIADASLASFVMKAAEAKRVQLLLILDQFEEYFLYRPVRRAQEDAFLMQIVRLIRNDEIPVNIMFCLRDDGLSKLDVLKSELPAIYDTSIRLDYLSIDGAREAITKPLEQFSAEHGQNCRWAAEPGLVEDLLEQIRVGMVTVCDATQGKVKEQTSDRIETPYLQLVLTRLWEEQQSEWDALPLNHDRLLRGEVLRNLGGAEGIVRKHLQRLLDERLDAGERRTMAALARFMVTPDQGKVAQSEATLKQYASALLSPAQLMGVGPLLKKLEGPDFRVLRRVSVPSGDRFEVFHDTLGKALVVWQADYDKKTEEEQRKAHLDQLKKETEQQEEQRKRVVRARNVAAAIFGVAIVATGFAIWGKLDADRSKASAMDREIEIKDNLAFTQAQLATTQDDKEAIQRQAETLNDQLKVATAALQSVEKQNRQFIEKFEAVVKSSKTDVDIMRATQDLRMRADQSSRQIDDAKTLLENVQSLISEVGWQQGKMRIFGGPADQGRGDELALFSSWKEAADTGVFLADASSRSPLPKIGQLNPDAYYIAARWDYKETPKAWLQQTKAQVKNKAGKVLDAQPVDWGPAAKTGAIMDLSPGLAEALGVKQGDEASYFIQKPPPSASVTKVAGSTPDTTKSVFTMDGINDGRTRAVPSMPGWHVWVGKIDNKDQKTANCRVFKARSAPASYYTEAEVDAKLAAINAVIIGKGLIGPGLPLSVDSGHYQLWVKQLVAGLFKNDHVDVELRQK